jgi:hypothetical protein
MEDLITYFITTFGNNPYFQVVSAVVVLASAICALTPTPNPDTAWGKVYKFIELLALNIGKAKQ